MKTTLIILTFLPVLSFAQRQYLPKYFYGVQTGSGIFTDFGIGGPSFGQEIGFSIERESPRKFFAFRLLPAFTTANESTSAGFSSLSARYMMYDLSATVRFSIPRKKFRFSIESGHGASLVQRRGNAVYGSKDAETEFCFLLNVGLNVSYDVSKRMRIWFGVSEVLRLRPNIFDGDAYSFACVRIGAAWTKK